MSIPLGSYPGGYHLVDFGERYTSNGAEATIVFDGPSLFRYDLIGAYFPLWLFTADPTTGVCCANLIPGTGPTPYPDLLSAQVDETVSCGEHGLCLWPDTYSVGPGTNTCNPAPLDCDLPAPNPILMRPLYYSGKPGEVCDAQITINFRRKHHAGWPRFLYPCNTEQAYWRPPNIPPGTYIEVSRNPNTEARTIPGSGINWVVDEEYRWKNTVGGVNCQHTSYGPGPNATWCNAAPADSSLSDEQFGALVFAQELEVKWSGVPMADWNVLREMEGTVNEGVWLGFPPESVLFSHYEELEVPMFGCQDLFTITLHFNVMTGSVQPSTSVLTTEQQIIRGIYKNRVGLWNRFWSNEPMVIGTNDICTNWVPIRNRADNCCAASNRKLYLTECFDRIFAIPGCS
jgi:hypothetical protein